MITAKTIGALPYWLYHKYITKNDFAANMGYWFWMNGNERYLLNHDLKPESVVFEVGGYRGVFTEEIEKRFGCEIYVFEPVDRFVEELHQKFDSNEKIHIYDFGLGNKDKDISINVIDDKSSTLRENEERESQELIHIADIKKFVDKNKIKHIDLMNINIEGGEYELVPRITDTNIGKKIDFIQIQFHKVIDNSDVVRQELVEKLKKTHDHVFEIPFVWDGFKLKDKKK